MTTLCQLSLSYNENWGKMITRKHSQTIKWRKYNLSHSRRMETATENDDDDTITILLREYSIALNRHRTILNGWQSIADGLTEKATLKLINKLLPDSLIAIIGDYCPAVRDERTRGLIVWLNNRYALLYPIVNLITTWNINEVRYVSTIMYGKLLNSNISKSAAIAYIKHTLDSEMFPNDRLSEKEKAIRKYGKILSIHNYRAKIDALK